MVANVGEMIWLRQLFLKLHCPIHQASVVSMNPVQRQRTKHIKIDLHFVRVKIATGAV